MSQDPQMLADEIKALNGVKAGLFKLCEPYMSHPTMQNALRLCSDQLDLAYLTLTNVGGTLNFIETQPEAEVAAGNVRQFPEGGASNGAS
jgi:hypothetical protein